MEWFRVEKNWTYFISALFEKRDKQKMECSWFQKQFLPERMQNLHLKVQISWFFPALYFKQYQFYLWSHSFTKNYLPNFGVLRSGVGERGVKIWRKIDDVIYEWLQNLIPKMDPKMAYQITTAGSSIKG